MDDNKNNGQEKGGDQTKIYENVTVSNLFREIHENNNARKKQIDDTVISIIPLITSANDVMMIMPVVKDLIQTSVNNDNLLVNVLQIVTKSKKKDDDLEDVVVPYKVMEQLKEKSLTDTKELEELDKISKILKEKIVK